MKDERSEDAADRPLEVAAHGREQSRPTGSLRPPAVMFAPVLCPSAARITPADHSLRRGTACCARCNAADRRYPLADTRSIPASAAPLPFIARSTQQFVPKKGHFSVTPTRFCPKSRSHTKHTTKPPLPGSRFAHRNAPTSLAKPLSNRELHLLEPALTHRKQTTAPRSNRELSTNPCRGNSHFPTESFANSSVCPTFLTGSASQTEFAVTNSKQTTGAFLTGSRFARYGAGIDSFSRLAQHGAHPK
jgi:hypothetical protein